MIRPHRILILSFLFFFSISLVFSIKYYAASSIFNSDILSVYDVGDFNYYLDLSVENNLPGKFIYDVEIIYNAENLVVANQRFSCNNYCERNFQINKVFFGDYTVIVISKYDKKYYRKKMHFSITEPQVETYNALFKPTYNIENGRLNISGTIESNSSNNINYYFEIFPKSAPDSLSSYNLTCSGNCDFSFIRDFEIVLDDYNVRIYSPLGEMQKSFSVKYNPPVNNTNNQTNKNETKIDIEKIKTNPSEYFLYDNNKRINDTNVVFKKGDLLLNSNQIDLNQTYDIEFNFINKKIDKIVVNNVLLENLSIGYEELEEKNINLSKITILPKVVSSAFAINPKSSNLSATYNLTYIATGYELYKCVDYNFTTRNCQGNFVKILDTIPNKKYTISLDMIDPLFVELTPPTFNVQRGFATGTTSTITSTITPVNINESLILFTNDVSDTTPDDIFFTPYFSNNNIISFDRYDGIGISANLAYQVISSNQFNVQRGQRTLSVGSASINVPINFVNLNETFVVVYGRCADEATNDNMASFFYGNLTNSTNLLLVRGQETLCEATVSYQIVEFSGSKVQKGLSQFDSTLTSVATTINNINQQNTFLVFGSASIGSDPGMNTNLIRGDIFSNTQVVFNRNGADGISNRDIYWYVVEHPDILVQKNFITIGSDTTENLATAVNNMSKTFHIESYGNTGGGQTWRNTLYSSNLTSNSTIFFKKTTNSQTIYLQYFVVEFKGVLTHTTIGQVNLNATTIYNMTSDNLFCNYQLDNGVSSIFVDWSKNSNSIFDLALPFEGNISNALLDYSGNSNNIISNSGAIWSSSSGYDGNSSYYFNYDQMLISHNSNLNLKNFNTTFGIWFYPTITSGLQTILSKNNSYSIRLNNDELELELYNDKNYTTTTANILANSWNYLNIIIDENMNITFYLNSNKLQTNKSFYIIDSTDNFIIGNDKNNNYFNGYLDNLFIYNIELSLEQILNIYQNKTNQLSNTITEGEDIWQCSVYTFSPIKYGFLYPSNTILINDNSPKISNLLINSTGIYNYFYDNLSCNYNLAATATSSTFNWYVNSKSISLLNLPFEGNSSNALNDYSGNEYKFTNNNAIWLNLSGYNSTSVFSFDGSSSYLKYDIADMTIRNFTLSMWVKSTNTNQALYTSIFSSTDISSDTNSFQIDFDGAGNYEYRHNSFILNIGPATTSWQHIAIVSNGSSHTTYLDGNPVATSTVDSDTIFYLYKLGVNRNTNVFYNGLIDDVLLFNKTLSANQIKNIYQGNRKMDFENTKIGEMWQCRVIPFSLYKAGKIYSSNIIRINDNVSVPTITNLNLRSAAYLNSTEENLYCDFSYTPGPFTTFTSWFNGSNPFYIMALPFDGNSSNALLDYSGNGWDGLAYGNAAWIFDEGHRGGSYYFDGNNDYIDFGDVNNLDNPSTFSVSLWFKRVVDNSGTALDTNHLVNNVLIAQSSKTTNDNFELGSEGGNIELYVDTAGTDNYNYYAGILNNVWHHVVVTYDEFDTNELKLYVDGNFIMEWSTPSGPLATSNAPLTLGMARPDGDYWGDYNGYIDDLLIFPYELNQEDVNNLYNDDYNRLSSKFTFIGDNWSCQVNAFSSMGKAIPQTSNSILILKLKRIYLQLEKKIRRVSDSLYNIFLSLSNLENDTFPKSRNVSILAYLPNKFNISSTFSFSSYYLYSTNFLNQSISQIDYNGTLYKFELSPTTNYVFDSYNGEFNLSNQFNLSFNITGSGKFNISEIIFGLDSTN